MAKQNFTVNIFIRRVGVGEVNTDVAQARCPKQCIANGMKQYIGIAVPNGTFGVLNFYPSQP